MQIAVKQIKQPEYKAHLFYFNTIYGSHGRMISDKPTVKIPFTDLSTPPQVAYYWARGIDEALSVVLWLPCEHVDRERVYSGDNHWRICKRCGDTSDLIDWDEYAAI